MRGHRYTNILIGKITNEIMIGGWLNDTAAVDRGEARLSHWLNFTRDNQGVFIHEYSSTFCKLAIRSRVRARC
eukprot:COSAG04_NODE_1857_length_5376_cov_16.572295_6_plen_73_part_00